MIEQSISGARLCPNCANTIQENAAKCPYCKAEFSEDSAPHWLNRNTPVSERPTDSKRIKRSPIPARLVWPAATLLLVLLALSLIHISEPTRLLSISYAVFCLKKKN